MDCTPRNKTRYGTVHLEIKLDMDCTPRNKTRYGTVHLEIKLDKGLYT